MRCFLTGASGFLGSYVLRDLLRGGHEVTILLRPSSDPRRIRDLLSNVDIVNTDLDDTDTIHKELQRKPAKAFLHLAWDGVTAKVRNDANQITRNVPQSVRLCEIAQQTGCESWIGLGSQAEYGPYSCILHEDLPANPVSAYGVAKLATCMLTGKMCDWSKMRHVWLRVLSIYGPMDDERHLIPMAIETLLRGEKPSVTTGEQIWDYLYVADCARAVSEALQSTASGIFNLGSSEPTTIRAVLEKLRDCVDPSLPLGFGEVPYADDQVMHLEADCSRFSTATGWSPKVKIVEGLMKTANWHRECNLGLAAGAKVK